MLFFSAKNKNRPTYAHNRSATIIIGNYIISTVLLTLALILVLHDSSSERTYILFCFSLLFMSVTYQVFTVSFKNFIFSVILEILAVLALDFSLDPLYGEISVMLITVVIFSIVLRVPAKPAFLLCFVMILLPISKSIFADGFSVAIFAPTAIESVILILSIQVVSYRENLVLEKDKVEIEKKAIYNLSAANDSLLRNLPEMKEESAEKERLRITRELHDTLGYSMTNIVMIMNAAQYLIDNNSEKVREYCIRTKELSLSTMDEIRTTLYKLRAIGHNIPDNPAIFFQHLCNDFEEATGVSTQCHSGNLVRRLPKKIFDAVLRTVQVGFINALKHGKTTKIRLYFWISGSDLQMSIWNSIENTQMEQREIIKQGIGLSGIKERLEELEGRVSAEYVADGFKLNLSIPYKEAIDGKYPGNHSG